MHLVVSVINPSDEVINLLKKYPLKIHVSGEPQHSSDGAGGLLNKLIPGFSVFKTFKTIVNVFTNTEVCVADPASWSVTFLHTGSNYTNTSSYNPTVEDMKKMGRGSPYMEHSYNPLHRKAVLNSRDERRRNMTLDGKMNDKQDLDSDGTAQESKALCQQSKNLKEALQFVKNSFPQLQHLLLLQTGYALSPDFVR